MLGGMPECGHAMLVPTGIRAEASRSTRSTDLRTIQKTLESKMIRARLHQLGLSDSEIQQRLSRMSDPEVHQFASQIRAVRPAGDVIVGILVIVLLVVLIIYLVKRL